MEAIRRHPVLVTIAGVALAIVIVFAATGVAVWRAAHTDDASLVDRVDVILVLGAAQYNGDPSPVFEGRLRHAEFLYDEGRADTILVLGGGVPGDSSTEAESGRDWRMKRMASDLGIEAYASATWQSAARTEGTRFGGYVRETLAYLYYRFSGH